MINTNYNHEKWLKFINTDNHEIAVKLTDNPRYVVLKAGTREVVAIVDDYNKLYSMYTSTAYDVYTTPIA